jgi:copper oxidase (laccase) domain-containing protein
MAHGPLLRPGLAWREAGAAELLHAGGIGEVRAAGLCTADDPARFFSARRDRRTGRQAGVIVAR